MHDRGLILLMADSSILSHRDLNNIYVESALGIKYMATGLELHVANNNKMLMGEVGCFLSHYTIWKKVS